MDWLNTLRGDYLVEKYTTVVNGTIVIHEDDLIDNYYLINSPLVFIIIGIYLLISLKGPKLMEKRAAFNLREIMIAYNTFQVCFCSLFLYIVFISLPGTEILSFIFSNVCRPVGQPYDSIIRVHALHGTYVYFVMKIFDLPDTIFMVLRKNFSHITFLHLFHHTTMVLSMWYHLKYVRGELGPVFGIINVFVHVIMYSYYLISGLGPKYRAMVAPYKRYVTLLQLGQFALILSIMGYLIFTGCEMPPNLMNMWLFNNVLFFVLFLNFYIRNYLANKSGKKQK